LVDCRFPFFAILAKGTLSHNLYPENVAREEPERDRKREREVKRGYKRRRVRIMKQKQERSKNTKSLPLKNSIYASRNKSTPM
jgi:hypothetical protein